MMKAKRLHTLPIASHRRPSAASIICNNAYVSDDKASSPITTSPQVQKMQQQQQQQQVKDAASAFITSRDEEESKILMAQDTRPPVVSPTTSHELSSTKRKATTAAVSCLVSSPTTVTTPPTKTTIGQKRKSVVVSISKEDPLVNGSSATTTNTTKTKKANAHAKTPPPPPVPVITPIMQAVRPTTTTTTTTNIIDPNTANKLFPFSRGQASNHHPNFVVNLQLKNTNNGTAVLPAPAAAAVAAANTVAGMANATANVTNIGSSIRQSVQGMGLYNQNRQGGFLPTNQNKMQPNHQQQQQITKKDLQDNGYMLQQQKKTYIFSQQQQQQRAAANGKPVSAVAVATVVPPPPQPMTAEEIYRLSKQAAMCYTSSRKPSTISMTPMPKLSSYQTDYAKAKLAKEREEFQERHTKFLKLELPSIILPTPPWSSSSQQQPQQQQQQQQPKQPQKPKQKQPPCVSSTSAPSTTAAPVTDTSTAAMVASKNSTLSPNTSMKTPSSSSSSCGKMTVGDAVAAIAEGRYGEGDEEILKELEEQEKGQGYQLLQQRREMRTQAHIVLSNHYKMLHGYTDLCAGDAPACDSSSAYPGLHHHRTHYSMMRSNAASGVTRDPTIQPDETPSTIIRDEPFPYRVHQMLVVVEEEGLGHIVSWQPHGRCFKVHDKEGFTTMVLGRFFDQSMFASFQRQLNIWGFTRITAGPDKHAYYHEMFLRQQPNLVKQMKRLKNKGTKRQPSRPEKEPNLYLLPYLPENPRPYNRSSEEGDDDNMSVSLSCSC